ncbi:MAG: hypothetical protein LBG79_05205 [Spirochaetaceae bacterium]|jgi:hypothetical protein|nr:hypothetical protein [Spirochaetaceae bacterium]
MVSACYKNIFIIFILIASAGMLNAATYEDGRIKLVLDEAAGRFSLYYMTDVDKKIFEPLFWDRDKKTSFIGVMLNKTEYRMGETMRFRVYLRGTDFRPALVFESPSVQITAEFSFIRTASSGVSNGIRIDMKMENWGEKTIDIGMRLVIDTNLGESSKPDFHTNLRPIESELMIDQTDRDQWWLSRNSKYGLMGSVFVDGTDPPSAIHFANWKRIYSANFKPEYVPTRNFNEMPFSIRDSAVCYYLDSRPLEKWESRKWTVLLAAEDKYGFDVKKAEPVIRERIIEERVVTGGVRGEDRFITPQAKDAVKTPEEKAKEEKIKDEILKEAAKETLKEKTKTDSILLPIGPVRVDIMTLRELIYKVDEYIYFGTAISEEELRGMEMTLIRLESRYGGLLSPYFRPRYER